MLQQDLRHIHVTLGARNVEGGAPIALREVDIEPSLSQQLLHHIGMVVIASEIEWGTAFDLLDIQIQGGDGKEGIKDGKDSFSAGIVERGQA